MATSSNSSPPSKWHPSPTFHIKASRGWLNDPCAPGYDTTTNTYHLFYQWNPQSCQWGHICWGHLTSRDGVHWEHDGTEPVLEPSMPYDKEGVFTGCLYPSGPQGQNGQLSAFYSSVCNLPFNWTKPYPRNSAGVAFAVSEDGGRTWKKSERNPILMGEPEDAIVTGFRDPYIAKWPTLDKLRGEKSLYGTISGGIRDKGPTAFFYAIEPHDMSKWKYIGALLELPAGFCPSRKWNGDFGVNWECANFMTLKNGDDEREFVLIGSEGGLQREHLRHGENPYSAWCLWMSGRLRHEDGVWMSYEFSGVLDHGCFYAANSFEDPNSKKRIVWGWLQEEDLTPARCEWKGWSGYLSLPREIFYLYIPNVVKALKTPLSDIASVDMVENESGTKMLQTLGIRPLSNLGILRQTVPLEWFNSSHPRGEVKNLTKGTNWNLEAIIKITDSTDRIGFHIKHNEDLSQRTSIYFSPLEEEIFVDRSLSNSEADIRKTNESGPFTLFTTCTDGVEAQEKLRLQIFCDGDIVEIFANDRFALSTVVYVDSNKSSGVSCFVDGRGSENGIFESVRIWSDLDSI